MKTLNVIILILLSLTAKADFSGIFIGSGTVSDSSGWNEKCESMRLHLEETATELKLVELLFHCGSMSVSQKPYTLKIENGKLIAGRNEVGTIDSKNISIDILNSQGHYIWKINRNADGSISYYDYTPLTNERKFLEIRGTLK